jgi:hypothetical protein
MVDNSEENNCQSDMFKNMVTTKSSLSTNISSEKNESEWIALEKNKEYLNGNCCYSQHISRIDNALKNIHKRWSTID